MLITSGILLTATATAYAENAPDSIDPNEVALFDPNETALFELINAARKSPLDMAELLGMDRNQLLKDLPEMADILILGLPELALNVRLGRTAKEHTADMLENSYYSYDSIDGRSVDQRMTDAGYMPAKFGESLGMIAFNNFLNSQKAVLQIFKNIYRNELDSAFEGQRNILDPNVTDVGVSFQGGVFTFGRFTVNSYFVTCDFARPVEIYELQMVNLINQLRANPLPVLSEFEIDATVEDFPEFTAFLTEGLLPPLAYDLSLYSTADKLVVDMFENNHFTGRTADGRTLEERLADTGYLPAWAQESRIRLLTCDGPVPPLETVPGMYEYLIKMAFHADPTKRDAAMLTPEAEDIGVRVMAGQSSELGGICGDDLHIMVADFGTRLKGNDSDDSGKAHETDDSVYGQLIGLIYEDINANGLYDAGEGADDRIVTLDRGPGTDIAYKVCMNPAGGFAVNLSQGRYRIAVETYEGELMTRWVTVDMNEAVWFSLDARAASEVDTP